MLRHTVTVPSTPTQLKYELRAPWLSALKDLLSADNLDMSAATLLEPFMPVLRLLGFPGGLSGDGARVTVFGSVGGAGEGGAAGSTGSSGGVAGGGISCVSVGTASGVEIGTTVT